MAEPRTYQSFLKLVEIIDGITPASDPATSSPFYSYRAFEANDPSEAFRHDQTAALCACVPVVLTPSERTSGDVKADLVFDIVLAQPYRYSDDPFADQGRPVTRLQMQLRMIEDIQATLKTATNQRMNGLNSRILFEGFNIDPDNTWIEKFVAVFGRVSLIHRDQRSIQ